MADKKKKFKEIYENHFDDLFRYLMWATADEETAADLTQNTFESLWVMMNDKKTIPDNPSAWLYSVSRNKLFDFYRAKKIENTNSFNIAPDNINIRDERENISRNYELSVMEKEITEIISGLEAPLSTVVYLIDVKKIKYRTAEKIMGISERTIRNLRKKAWKMIEDELTRLSFPDKYVRNLPAKGH